MARKAHHTVRPVKRGEQRDASDAAEAMLRELSTHYARTYAVRIDRRAGAKWEAVAEVDVFHGDELDGALVDDTPQEDLIKELADQLLSTVRADAIEAPGRYRVVGSGQREHAAPLWSVSWLEGVHTSDELEAEARAAATQTIGVLSRSVDQLCRHLDRAMGRHQQLADAALKNAADMMESQNRHMVATGQAVAQLVKISTEIAGPSVERYRIEMEAQAKKLEHEANAAQDDREHELLMTAVREIARAARTPKVAKPDASTSTQAAAETATAATTTTSSPGTTEPPKRAPMPREGLVPQALELVEILESLDDAAAAQLLSTLSDDEAHALRDAAAAKTPQAWDHCFARLYTELQRRGDAGLHDLLPKIGPLLGGDGMLFLMAELKAHERRHGR